MLFSYGFLEDGWQCARTIFLDLDIPSNDELKQAKMAASEALPGCRLFRVRSDDGRATGVDWEGDFIWLACANEEDGLNFRMRQYLDGKQEIQAFWLDRDLGGEPSRALAAKLRADPQWDVYHLRGICLVAARVESQLQALTETEAAVAEAPLTADLRVQPCTWELVTRLRRLEQELLMDALRELYAQVSIGFFLQSLPDRQVVLSGHVIAHPLPSLPMTCFMFHGPLHFVAHTTTHACVAGTTNRLPRGTTVPGGSNGRGLTASERPSVRRRELFFGRRPLTNQPYFPPAFTQRCSLLD